MEGQFGAFDLLNMGGQYEIIHEDAVGTTYKVSFPQLNNWSIGVEVSKDEAMVVLGLLEGNQIGDSIIDLYPTPAVFAEIKAKLPAPNNPNGGKRKGKKKTMRRRR